MIIDTIHIKNFRCVADHSIKFEKITSFIGPNGAGKSTVLRALDWLFNSAKDSLAPTDVFGAFEETDKAIAVTVTFTELTPRDREVLTERYAPPQSDTFSVRREWSSATGDRLAGASKGYPAFFPVRRLIDGPAAPVKSAYDDVREKLMENSIVLPEAKTKPAIIKALDAWEKENPGELVLDFVTDNQMFGFAGQGELAKIFTYVFVDADLRAYDEAEDSSKTILGKLLSRALDRSPAEAALTDLANEVTQKHNAINDEHLGPQLETISGPSQMSMGSRVRGGVSERVL